MKIPKKIQISGKIFDIEIHKNKIDEEGSLGLISYDDSKIDILKMGKQNDINLTFLHEIVHAILYLMQRNKLKADEAFVDQFAGLLNQVLKQIYKS